MVKKREFNKILRECSDRKTKILKEEAILALPDETKQALLLFIQRHRGPILEILVNPLTDLKNLHSCGYLHKERGRIFNFLCTMENKVNIRNMNLRDAKAQAKKDFGSLDGFQGVRLGSNSLKFRVRNKSVAEKLPSEYQGFNVEIEVVGDISVDW